MNNDDDDKKPGSGADIFIGVLFILSTLIFLVGDILFSWFGV